MFRTVHRVSIDIGSVPYRGCRAYQEKIVDFGQTGKPLFEWDKMRQRYYMHALPQILNICTPCPMNVFGGIEGCEGEVEGLTVFLKVLMHLRPDSPVFKYQRFQSVHMMHDDTRAFIAEMHRVQELMTTSEWPVAQVMEHGYAKAVDGPRGVLYYEYEGDEDETFIFSNDGYTVGVAREGLIVRDAAGQRVPTPFAVLTRQGGRVTGETLEGQVLEFEAVRDARPAWDEQPDYVDTQLAFTRVMAGELFSDVLQVFTTCGEIALKHNTGLRIQLLS